MELKYCDLSTSKPKSTDFNDTYITFTGYLDNLSKKKALVDSNIFILTSHSENFGMSVIEAMACGLPVIISKHVGIFNEIINNEAGIVVNNNLEKITESVIKLSENLELRKKMNENAKLFINKNYDINKISHSMSGVFEKIVSNKLNKSN